MSRFDLIREPWIPVEGAETPDVSLLDALVQAHEFGGLALADPLQAVALLRQVLLPVLFDATGLPTSEDEWAERWSRGKIDGEVVGRYFEKRSDRFDLFHSVQPFAQVAGLRTEKNETKPVSLLLPSAATGNNVPLFSARTEAEPPDLTPAQAARALVAAQCWDTAAIKSGAVGDENVRGGKTTGNPVAPVGQLGVVVPLGATLFETFMLNTPIVRQGVKPGDQPQWMASPARPEWKTRPATGLLDLLTWQARRVRLVPDEDADGSVVVRRVVLAAGDRLSVIPAEEPHTAWVMVKKPRAGQPSNRPLLHRPGREPWRGMAALLATKEPTAGNESSSRLLGQVAILCDEGLLPTDLRLQVLTVGIQYGNQSAVVEDVMLDLMPLPIAALPPDSEPRRLLLQVADQAEQMRIAANQLGDEIRRATRTEALPWDKGQRLGDTLVHELTPLVRRLLAGLQREPDRVDEANQAWRAAARACALAAAEPLLNAAPPQAFFGREAQNGWAHRLNLAEAQYRGRVADILGYPRKQKTRSELGSGAPA
ncbi:type I-E CRISPR-associated protein Cse1/CasA [Amycolatopsis taiwanensis]|uniref:CRISPR-associated protein CasA/Cse1 n=1 Tax=Amycolatopsis taiwanensis TaxID=342230 RepID=A0A9W6R3V7_9PSEU|nr:type I-E CRISPR-associated protein Cse1/CasA [Amycolatopsis taiwanensis]GLY68778.1 CRISPR-associated protein CasA/Cse1 [Amycolatopsis taiwanensis]